MAKKGTYNSGFFSSFQARLHGTPIQFGYLIGAEAAGGPRSVLYAAATPPQLDSDGMPLAPIQDLAAMLKSSDAADFGIWAQQHAKALSKLLPGGLETCGCFIVASEAAARDLAAPLAPLLTGIQEPLILVLDRGAGKLSFYQHSGGGKPSLRPVQLKADPQADALLLRCQTHIDVVMPFSVEEADGDDEVKSVERRRKHDQRLLTAVKGGVADALRSCTAAVQADEGPMRIVDMASEANLATSLPKECDEAQVHFLHGGSVLNVAANPSGRPVSRYSGLVVATVLLLRRDMELREAIAKLREQLAASAVERLVMTLEDEEEEADPYRASAAPLQLPWRAFAKPEDCDLPLWFSDYCMGDETVETAHQRLSELLAVPQDCFEECPDELDEDSWLKSRFAGTYNAAAVSAACTASCARSSGGREAKEEGGRKGPAMGSVACVAAVAVAAAALAVPMLLRI